MRVAGKVITVSAKGSSPMQMETFLKAIMLMAKEMAKENLQRRLDTYTKAIM